MGQVGESRNMRVKTPRTESDMEERGGWLGDERLNCFLSRVWQAIQATADAPQTKKCVLIVQERLLRQGHQPPALQESITKGRRQASTSRSCRGSSGDSSLR